MKKLNLLIAVAIGIFLFSCSQVPLTGRSQLSLVDDATLQNEAANAYSQFLADPTTKVISKGTDAQRVSTVGNKLASAINLSCRQMVSVINTITNISLLW